MRNNNFFSESWRAASLLPLNRGTVLSTSAGRDKVFTKYVLFLDHWSCWAIIHVIDFDGSLFGHLSCHVLLLALFMVRYVVFFIKFRKLTDKTIIAQLTRKSSGLPLALLWTGLWSTASIKSLLSHDLGLLGPKFTVSEWGELLPFLLSYFFEVLLD